MVAPSVWSVPAHRRTAAWRQLLKTVVFRKDLLSNPFSADRRLPIATRRNACAAGVESLDGRATLPVAGTSPRRCNSPDARPSVKHTCECVVGPRLRLRLRRRIQAALSRARDPVVPVLDQPRTGPRTRASGSASTCPARASGS
eukprot:131158-Chlamydomonas_euryale.AAC.4